MNSSLMVITIFMLHQFASSAQAVEFNEIIKRAHATICRSMFERTVQTSSLDAKFSMISELVSMTSYMEVKRSAGPLIYLPRHIPTLKIVLSQIISFLRPTDAASYIDQAYANASYFVSSGAQSQGLVAIPLPMNALSEPAAAILRLLPCPQGFIVDLYFEQLPADKREAVEMQLQSILLPEAILEPFSRVIEVTAKSPLDLLEFVEDLGRRFGQELDLPENPFKNFAQGFYEEQLAKIRTLTGQDEEDPSILWSRELHEQLEARWIQHQSEPSLRSRPLPYIVNTSFVLNTKHILLKVELNAGVATDSEGILHLPQRPGPFVTFVIESALDYYQGYPAFAEHTPGEDELDLVKRRILSLLHSSKLEI